MGRQNYKPESIDWQHFYHSWNYFLFIFLIDNWNTSNNNVARRSLEWTQRGFNFHFIRWLKESKFL